MDRIAPPPEHGIPEVVVFGDFNCPFSALASARAEELERKGVVRVDWHAVEHDPLIPPAGEPVVGETREDLRRELAVIRDLLGADEADVLRLPTRRVNTGRATSAYAGTHPERRSDLRRRLFAAYWQHDLDLADPSVLFDLGAVGSDDDLVSRWSTAWHSLPQRIVPAMVLPDGHVSRGLGALARMADRADGNPELLHGQRLASSEDQADRSHGPPSSARRRKVEQ